MKNNAHIFAYLLLVALLTTTAAGANGEQERAQTIKAAFLYNFINFVDWPNGRMEDDNDPVVIVIVGNKDFVKEFDPIRGKKIKERNVVIKYLDTLNNLKHSLDKKSDKSEQLTDTLRKCHAVFVSSGTPELETDCRFIINALEGAPVLIVGEQPGFLEKAGHINFLMEDNKIRFEVNLVAAKKNQIKIRSQLLKLAIRVISEQPQKGE